MQDCSNSIANALELLQSCTKPSISSFADGRAGTFIAVDYLSDMSKNKGTIDVVKFMNDLSPDSPAIIQTSVSWKIPYDNAN